MKTPSPENDIIISTLKKKYFDLAAKENIGLTPEITKEIDNLEEAIKELIKKNS
ncbi:MAG: hypothetical protein Q7R95_10730 [bacterium]|nr:hypothetical protein [bacterium]